MTEFEVLQERRRFLLEPLSRAADEIAKIDARLKSINEHFSSN
jgi:hypothetical protein